MLHKILLPVFLLIAISSSLLAQKMTKHYLTAEEVVRDTPIKKIVNKPCGNYLSYMYDTLHPEFFPMRYVRINIHVIQDANGGHNFSEAEGTKWVKQLVSDANQQLGNNQRMNLPVGNTTSVYPIPFRYVLTGKPGDLNDDGIYFHRNDSLFWMNKKGDGKTSVFSPQQFNLYGIQKDTVINVFLIEHNPDSIKSPTYKASNDGVGLQSWVKVVGCYYIWKHPTVLENGDTMFFTTWNAAGLFNHELGHSLGLNHTWNMDDGCEDTPKNPGCWNYGEPPCDVVSNNVMDYNAYKNSCTPCQIAKITGNFYRDIAQRRFIMRDWCEYDSTRTIIIRSGEKMEWNGSMDLYGNLVIQNNASLIIHCTVSLPPGAKIILKPKASLYIDSGTLTCRCEEGKQWDGIIINQSKKNKPTVGMKSTSVIEHLVHGF